MFIFLDESGDLGFDFANKKLSTHFVITLLVCRDNKTVQVIEKSIARTLKNKINLKAGTKKIKHELKGTEATLQAKQYFYRHISADTGWEIYSIVLNKKKLLKTLKEPPVHKNLYNHLARTVLEKVAFDSSFKLVRLVDRCKNVAGIAEFNCYVADHLAGFLPIKLIKHLECNLQKGWIQIKQILKHLG